MYIDFNTTRDRESRKILRLLEASRLKTFCSKRSSQNKTLDSLGIKFYINGTFSVDSIETRVGTTHLSITKSSLANLFETNDAGVNSFTYKEDNWIESFELFARPSCRGVRKELKKYLLRRKYRLLMTILTKCILGEQNSHDGLSKPRLCCLRAIIDGVKVDWIGALLLRFQDEKKRFSFDTNSGE